MRDIFKTRKKSLNVQMLQIATSITFRHDRYWYCEGYSMVFTDTVFGPVVTLQSPGGHYLHSWQPRRVTEMLLTNKDRVPQ